MNAFNPLQLSAKLGRNVIEINTAIKSLNIEPQRIGLRAGLYDADEVTKALTALDEQKKAEAKKK